MLSGGRTTHRNAWAHDLPSQGDLTASISYYLRMAAMRQTTVVDRPVHERPIARRAPRGLPVGAFGWERRSSSPAAPERFTAEPGQIVLGQALAARVAEATRMIADAAVATGRPELASGRFAKPIHDLHKLATRAIARFLVTGQGTTEIERNFIGRVGVMAAVLGLSFTTMGESYLLWRDANLRILNEEVKRLGTSLAVYDAARRLIRSSAETGMKRMAQAYEDQMQVVGRRQEGTALPLHRPERRLT